jgi:hypothetical protein
MLSAFKLKNYILLLSLGLLITLLACEDKKIDTKAVKEEMKAREIKVIPEAKILDKAMVLGNELSSGFIYHRASNKADMPVKQGSKIQPKTSFNLLDGENNLKGKEKMLFEAYLYNSENGINSEANVQSLNKERSLLYTAPLISEGNMIGMWSIIFLRKEIVQSIDD